MTKSGCECCTVMARPRFKSQSPENDITFAALAGRKNCKESGEAKKNTPFAEKVMELRLIEMQMRPAAPSPQLFDPGGLGALTKNRSSQNGFRRGAGCHCIIV